MKIYGDIRSGVRFTVDYLRRPCDEHALRILSRMLELHADAQQGSPIPDTLASAESRSQVDWIQASFLGWVRKNVGVNTMNFTRDT